MNELINIAYTNDRPTVSGRELHYKLEIKTAYKDWFPRMCEYGFDENTDYILVAQKRATNNPKNPETTYNDHQLTIEMAKQICMIQRSDAGRRYREYFLEVERQWNSPEAVMSRALRIANAKLEEVIQQNNLLEKHNAELQPKADYYDTVAKSDGLTSFRETAKLFAIKEREFIKFLESHKYLYRNSMGKLIPYALYTPNLFEVKEVVYKSRCGNNATTVYTKITPKGREVLLAAYRKYMED